MADKKDWTQDLRKRFEAFESVDTPDADALWSAIEARMEADTPPAVVPRAEVPRVGRSSGPVLHGWRRAAAWAAAVALVALLGGGGWFVGRHMPEADVLASSEDVGQTSAATPDVPNVHPEGVGALASDDRPMGETLQGAERSSSGGANPPRSLAHRPTVAYGASGPCGASPADPIAVTVGRLAETPRAESPHGLGIVPARRTAAPSRGWLSASASPALPHGTPRATGLHHQRPTRRPQGGWAVRLLAAGLTSASATVDGYGALAADSKPLTWSRRWAAPATRLYTDRDPAYMLAASNRYEEVITRAHHRQPVRYGARLDYRLSPRWSITTGLDYTQLVSELTAGSDHSYYRNEQTLHYLGVPLGVSYQWLRRGRFGCYVALGTETELGVMGRMDIDCYVAEQLRDHRQRGVGTLPVEVSLTAGAGAHYELMRHLSLYAEPGLCWHADDRSSLIMLYNQKPLNFSLSVGLRWTVH